MMGRMYEEANNANTHIFSHWESWGQGAENGTDIGNDVVMCGISMVTYQWKQDFSEGADRNTRGKGPLCQECVEACRQKAAKLSQQASKYEAMVTKYGSESSREKRVRLGRKHECLKD